MTASCPAGRILQRGGSPKEVPRSLRFGALSFPLWRNRYPYAAGTDSCGLGIPVHGLSLYRLLRLRFLLQDSLDAIPVPVRHDLHGARMLLDRRRADFRLTPWHRHGQGHRRPQGCEGGRAVLEGERKGRP